jgi:hypothetical protein
MSTTMKAGTVQRMAVVVGCVAIGLSLPSLEATASGTKIVPYTGEAPADPGAQVQLEVRKRGGENYRADFHIQDLTMTCSDGTTQRTQLGPEIRFTRKHTFYFLEEDEAPNSGDLFTLEVKGRILDGDRARGYIAYDEDRQDPPASGFPDLPDCSSNGKVRWRATRGAP